MSGMLLTLAATCTTANAGRARCDLRAPPPLRGEWLPSAVPDILLHTCPLAYTDSYGGGRTQESFARDHASAEFAHFRPHDCFLERLERHTLRRALTNRTLVILGESIMHQLFFSLACAAGGSSYVHVSNVLEGEEELVASQLLGSHWTMSVKGHLHVCAPCQPTTPVVCDGCVMAPESVLRVSCVCQVPCP